MTVQSRNAWERATEWPLTAIAVVFLAAYAWPILYPTGDSGWRAAAGVVTLAAWAAFVVDYAGRLAMSRSRWTFVREHPVDLAAVVLPVLRPLRLLRLVALLSVLNRGAGRSVRGRVVVYLIGATTLVLFVASLAVLDAERFHPGANINTYPDALWWAITTVSTVGYGDRFPVTGAGRAVAVGLMLGGIALLGTVTATFASYLVERIQEVEEASRSATRRDVRALADEVAALRLEVASHYRLDDQG